VTVTGQHRLAGRTASAQRSLYLASRTVGDVRALQRGHLVQHVARRAYHRGVIRMLRRAGVW
jgi:hypothetical protein